MSSNYKVQLRLMGMQISIGHIKMLAPDEKSEDQSYYIHFEMNTDCNEISQLRSAQSSLSLLQRALLRSCSASTLHIHQHEITMNENPPKITNTAEIIENYLIVRKPSVAHLQGNSSALLPGCSMSLVWEASLHTSPY